MTVIKIHRLPRAILTKCAHRMIYGLFRTITTSSRLAGSHYDALGITPKSTQGDIKSAYYKLSKLYHPDISSDETSAKKFRAITEAYEVLGNVKLKKMYDRGLLGNQHNQSGIQYEPEPEPEDPTLKFYKSHANRHITPTMGGKSPIYDFDAWSKTHYGDVFERSQYEKELLRKKRVKEMDTQAANRQEAVLYIVFVLGGLFIVLLTQGTSDYDRDVIRKEKQNKKVIKNVD